MPAKNKLCSLVQSSVLRVISAKFKTMVRFLPLICIAAGVLLNSCDEDNPLGIVTCPNESLETPTLTDTLAYSVYNKVLTTYYNSSFVGFGHVLQRTDDGLRSQEVTDKMNSLGVPYDTAALNNLIDNNPNFEYQVLENNFASNFSAIAHKENQCLDANAQYETKYSNSSFRIEFSAPGYNADSSKIVITYNENCGTGCGAQYIIFAQRPRSGVSTSITRYLY